MTLAEVTTDNLRDIGAAVTEEQVKEWSPRQLEAAQQYIAAVARFEANEIPRPDLPEFLAPFFT